MNQEKRKLKIYSAEFRASSVKLALDSDLPIAQTAKDLGVNANTLHTWINKYSQPKEQNKAVRTDEHLYDELKRLKKEIVRLTEECDLLKNYPPGIRLPMQRNNLPLHWINVQTLAVSFLEVKSPSKNLADGKLRTQLWRHFM